MRKFTIVYGFLLVKWEVLRLLLHWNCKAANEGLSCDKRFQMSLFLGFLFCECLPFAQNLASAWIQLWINCNWKKLSNHRWQCFWSYLNKILFNLFTFVGLTGRNAARELFLLLKYAQKAVLLHKQTSHL